MLYVDGKPLTKEQAWKHMVNQLDDFHADCAASGTPWVGRTPLTQKYYNKLCYLMAQEEEAAQNGLQGDILIQ